MPSPSFSPSRAHLATATHAWPRHRLFSQAAIPCTPASMHARAFTTNLHMHATRHDWCKSASACCCNDLGARPHSGPVTVSGAASAHKGRRGRPDGPQNSGGALWAEPPDSRDGVMAARDSEGSLQRPHKSRAPRQRAQRCHPARVAACGHSAGLLTGGRVCGHVAGGCSAAEEAFRNGRESSDPA